MVVLLSLHFSAPLTKGSLGKAVAQVDPLRGCALEDRAHTDNLVQADK